MLENLGGGLRLWSRNGRPLLRYFPELEETGALLPPDSALDGEIVIVQKGRLDFDTLKLRLHPAESRIRKLSAEIPAEYIAFDLLVWKGSPVHELPLEKRRKELERKAKRFQLSPATRDRKIAEKWLPRVDKAGLDGVIAKRLGLPYLPGSRDGVAKVKPYRTADCVIVGFRWSEKAEGRISTLLLGLYDDKGELDFVGHCSGFPAAVRRELEEALPKLAPEEHGQRQTDPRRPEPLVARQGDRLEPGAPEARLRGALRQARAQPLPARDEVHPFPPGQGPERLHLARGQAPAPRERPDRSEAPRWSLTQRRARPLRASTRSGSAGSRPSCSKRGIRLDLRRHMPAVRSPTLSSRFLMVLTVNLDGSQRATSFHWSGAETRASGVGRIE